MGGRSWNHSRPTDSSVTPRLVLSAQVIARSISRAVSRATADKKRPARFEGRIEFVGVHWAPPTDLRKPILNGISFTVEPGTKVALVGGTGCGKSTCMSLLQRLYDPQRGTIFVDGTPLPEFDVHYFRSRVVIVDQNTVLFSTTIRANIVYGIEREVDDQEVIDALSEAQARDEDPTTRGFLHCHCQLWPAVAGGAAWQLGCLVAATSPARSQQLSTNSPTLGWSVGMGLC